MASPTYTALQLVTQPSLAAAQGLRPLGRTCCARWWLGRGGMPSYTELFFTNIWMPPEYPKQP